MLSGFNEIVEQGKNITRGDGLAPRSALGLSSNATKLMLIVVDGRRPGYSVGITCPALADEMIKLGCYSGLLLDGGGSSTLVMRRRNENIWHVLNRPSDGSDLPVPNSIERPVANVLGVTIKDFKKRE